jgi:hypothetical protein
MGNNGYKRLAKYAPGSELIDERNHYLVLDVFKCEYDGHAYEILDYDTKQTLIRHRFKIEKMSFLKLINIGNYRLLHGDTEDEEKAKDDRKAKIQEALNFIKRSLLDPKIFGSQSGPGKGISGGSK